MSPETTPESPRLTLLLILDGWGVADASAGNAISRAHTPTLDRLQQEWPCAELACSGRAVGLPEGFMGNSEVGHMNLGAGRVIDQDMTRIDKAIEEDRLAENRTLRNLIEAVKRQGGRLHYMGLLSDGGVHSHQQHLYELIAIAKTHGVELVIHTWMDGRDTPPRSGLDFMRNLTAELDRQGWGRVGVVSGRYYAMDRDKRWDRVNRAYRALTLGPTEGIPAFEEPVAAVQAAYEAGENDEFITPRVVVKNDDAGTIRDGDGVFFFNFRADRARQLSRAFVDPDFDEFPREAHPTLAGFASMTEYDSELTALGVAAAFPPETYRDTLGEVVASHNLTQLRIAETEKYAHVTYFFNAGQEEPFPGEARELTPSPQDVATYDLKPEMSAYEVTERCANALREGGFSLVVCNLANLDMVGHTGVMEAAIKACEVVDACVDKLVTAVQDRGGQVLLTSDHGNAEEMLDAQGGVMTAHSTNAAPLVLIGEGHQGRVLRSGKLGDVAPTILKLWGMPQPSAMTGESLVD